MISHSLSGNPQSCWVQAIIWQVLYLIHTQELPLLETLLCAFLGTTENDTLKSNQGAFQGSIATQGINTLQITPKEIDARFLGADGATVLLCANLDPNSIRLIGQ